MKKEQQSSIKITDFTAICPVCHTTMYKDNKFCSLTCYQKINGELKIQ